jgi:hypothetical protein
MKVEQSLRDAHIKLQEQHTILRDHVHELITDSCEINKWYFIDRTKTLESYVLKILTGRISGYDIDDFYACTIVVPNLLAIEEARKLITACFEIRETRLGETTKSRPTEFNYDGLRFYCTLRPSVKQRTLNRLVFEVQIKTFLEHAWGVATHQFSYKGNSISWAKERLSAQIKAILDNVDLSIFEMESLSSSKFLDRKNPRYEELAEVLEFVVEKFGKQEDFLLPVDQKRLAQEIGRLIGRMNISLVRLEECLRQETELGRGYKTRNLSIYTVILVTLHNQEETAFERALKAQRRKGEPVIVIPEESELDEFYDQNDMKCGLFLKNCVRPNADDGNYP